MSVILCSRWFWKRKKYHDCYNSDVCYIVFKMVLKKQKVPRLLQLWYLLYCVQDGPDKGKRYHDCYNCDVGWIVFKMALKKKQVPRLLQLWCRLYCVQDGSEKEKGTTIVTTVMSVILCSRWPWKRKKVPRLLQQWCLLYCVQDGPEKGKRYPWCLLYCVQDGSEKEKGTTIATTVMSVILCSVTSTSNCHFTHVWNKITKNLNCSTELTMQVSKVVESMVMP